MAKRKVSFIARYVDAAEQHGLNSEPDHEIGDLQMAVYALWNVLTPAQRKTIEADEDLNDIIITWVDQ